MGYVRRRFGLLFSLVIVLAFGAYAPLAAADDPPPGAVWSEAYIDEADGTQLHADILRPASVPKDARTPVILSIGPYFNHSGQVGALGPVQDAPYEPAGDAGPSGRFYDFINGSKLLEKGYTFVMVDLRGFGGSSGCLDWSGPGEQADIKAAVEWAASQPWSTGKVGMYGKSYDAVTGMFGAALRPNGLAAVVAQEPVYDMYRYLYANGVRYPNSLLTPALYDGIAASPGTVGGDSAQYQQNSMNDTARPGCPAQNWADQAGNSDPNTDYWKQRDLIELSKGTKIPVFITQGFLENNTKPDGTWEYFNGSLAGPKRAWLGMWDHVRGNEVDSDGRLKMGRKGFFDEVMRWYDRYLKGIKAAVADPPVVVQTSDGTWRAEDQWPPRDVREHTSRLKPGTYTDDGMNNGTEQGYPETGDGVWTFSPRVPYDVHLAGEPRVTLDLELQRPGANLVVDVYDLDLSNSATLVSRNAMLVNESGTVTLPLYGNDWIVKRNHRLGVLVTSSNAEWWLHQPSLQDVRVKSGSIALPFLTCKRGEPLPGDPSIRLEDYLASAPFSVSASTVADGLDPAFALPAAQKDCSLKVLGKKKAKAKKRKASAKKKATRRKVGKRRTR